MSVIAPEALTAHAAAPITPDGDEARGWAEQELSQPVYDIAEPTPFDRAAHAVGDFFANLFSQSLPGEWAPAVAVIAAIVVIVLIGAGFLLWGVPRVARRAQQDATMLFGEKEERSAADLRTAASAHARAAEWDAAIVLRFRAIARACAERGVVDAPPGTTVHAFARAAGRAFPSLVMNLEDSASAFDDVRYLRRPGTADLYRTVVDTDDAMQSLAPAVEAGAFA